MFLFLLYMVLKLFLGLLQEISKNHGARHRPRQNNVDGERPNDVLCQIEGHGGPVSSLVFLPDGRHIASTCKDEKTIRVWSVEDRQEIQPPMNVGCAVNVVVASSDGKWVVSGDAEGKVAVWNSTSHQKEVESAERHGRKITGLDISPDSLRVASASDDGSVIIWCIQKGRRLVGPLKHQETSPVSSVKFSPGGGRIASGCTAWGCRSIRIWNSHTGAQLAHISADSQPTYSLAWSTDGQRLFAGGPSGSVRCIDVFNRTILGKWGDPQSDFTTSLCISTSGQFIISASASGRSISIWDIATRERLHPSFQPCEVLTAAVSPDGTFLANGGKDHRISIRSLSAFLPKRYFFHRLLPSLRQEPYSEPFTYISIAAYQAWCKGDLKEVETILSEEIAHFDYPDILWYTRANRALVRARLQKWDEASDDAEAALADQGSNVGQRPLVAHIARGFALCGQRKRSEAMNAFEIALQDCDSQAKEFMELVKSIIIFDVEFRDRLNLEANEHPDVDSPLVKAQMHLLLAEGCMMRDDSAKAVRLLTDVPDLGPLIHGSEAKIISLVFGWDLYDLKYMIHQLKCQALVASGRTQEAIEWLSHKESDLREEIEMKRADIGWLSEKYGDRALRRKSYDEAISWYSVALDHNPESRLPGCVSDFARKCLVTFERISDSDVDTGNHEMIVPYLNSTSLLPLNPSRLLVKRSKAKAQKGLWQDALDDADAAIKMDPTCPWGYESKHAALHALQCYEEAIGPLSDMVTKMEESADPGIRELRKNYVAPSETIAKIDEKITAILDTSPLVLLSVKTGRLCDATERIRIFKADPIFHELVSSMFTQLNIERIEEVVARYFRYVMFSHTWEGKEPTFQDVSGKSVYELDPLPLNDKLRCFCEMVRSDPEGYLWAWSDTCCIDKTIETVYRKSIRSMYSWYKFSALTLVLLARGSTPTNLKNNRWMTRAWTLQELLSPTSIRFYDRDWNLYRSDARPNHKESPSIMRELAEAIDVAQHTLIDFSPKSLSIRAKLRLASTREATEKVDIAYALIGIFSSDLIPEYRDPEDALGLLLQEIADREGEIKAVLDWVGKSSQFNSCLPAQISVYSQSPYSLPSIPEDEMENRVAELQTTLPRDAVTAFYEKLSHLDPPHFANRRLRLPCITFPVVVSERDGQSSDNAQGRGRVYRLKSAALGDVEITSMDTLPRGKMVLTYPWIRDLLARTHPHEYAHLDDHMVAHSNADSNTPTSPSSDEYVRTLRLLIHLEQPFRALLLVKQSAHEYKRFAADHEIIAPGCKLTSLEGIHAKVLGIL